MISAIKNEGRATETSINLLYYCSKIDKIVPFLLAGIGRGNAYVFDNRAEYKLLNSSNVNVLNLGAGIKSYIGKHIAVRTDYRYNVRSWEEKIRTWSGGSGGIYEHIGVADVSYSSHLFVFGLSYLF